MNISWPKLFSHLDIECKALFFYGHVIVQTVTSSLYTCTCIQYYSFNLWDFVWLQITDLTEEIKQLVEKKLRTEDPTDNKSALFKQQVRPCLVLKNIIVSTSDNKSCVRRFWIKVNTDQIMTLNIWMLVSFQY